MNKMPRNLKMLQVLTGCLVCAISFFLQLPAIASDDFDVKGEWSWAVPGTTTNAEGLPEGRWSGTFTIWRCDESDRSGSNPDYLGCSIGTLIGKFSDSRMTEIKVNGNSITFNRVISKKDKNGLDIQVWSGTIEARKGGGLRIKGTWSGAFDFVADEAKVSKDFVATKS